MSIRALTDIKRELERATERRTALWQDLSLAADENKAAEIARLTERIEQLWTEARTARTRERFGDQQAIIKRARAEDRLDRELAKVA